MMKYGAYVYDGLYCWCAFILGDLMMLVEMSCFLPFGTTWRRWRLLFLSAAAMFDVVGLGVHSGGMTFHDLGYIVWWCRECTGSDFDWMRDIASWVRWHSIGVGDVLNTFLLFLFFLSLRRYASIEVEEQTPSRYCWDSMWLMMHGIGMFICESRIRIPVDILTSRGWWARSGEMDDADI